MDIGGYYRPDPQKPPRQCAQVRHSMRHWLRCSFSTKSPRRETGAFLLRVFRALLVHDDQAIADRVSGEASDVV